MTTQPPSATASSGAGARTQPQAVSSSHLDHQHGLRGCAVLCCAAGPPLLPGLPAVSWPRPRASWLSMRATMTWPLCALLPLSLAAPAWQILDCRWSEASSSGYVSTHAVCPCPTTSCFASHINLVCVSAIQESPAELQPGDAIANKGLCLVVCLQPLHALHEATVPLLQAPVTATVSRYAPQ